MSAVVQKRFLCHHCLQLSGGAFGWCCLDRTQLSHSQLVAVQVVEATAIAAALRRLSEELSTGDEVSSSLAKDVYELEVLRRFDPYSLILLGHIWCLLFGMFYLNAVLAKAARGASRQKQHYKDKDDMWEPPCQDGGQQSGWHLQPGS
jgi:hypothetical protein